MCADGDGDVADDVSLSQNKIKFDDFDRLTSPSLVFDQGCCKGEKRQSVPFSLLFLFFLG